MKNFIPKDISWPTFTDGKPVVIGSFVKGVMTDIEVSSIVFRKDAVFLYDAGMFHYVKLKEDEKAQYPDGTRLPL